MKITYIRLENVAGLIVGSDRDFIEIDFSKSTNKIISIQGANSIGKTVLLSSCTPFATSTTLDERSTLPYIKVGRNGYKEIHYQDNSDNYIIKHYYKSTKDDSHTIKSYFALNGQELNESGNVTSFLSLVEFHFGLTQEMMRLMRLGSNVNSFISLTPARRKEYIGKLIEQIDLYLKIYKKINEDIRILKVLIASNNSNLYNCHISDLVIEEEKLHKLHKEIGNDERDHDKIIAKIGKIQSLERDNNIDDLRMKRQEAESSLIGIKKTEEAIISASLSNTTIDSLINKRNDFVNRRIDIQSKINSYRISIDNTLRVIERLETSIKRITSNSDIQSLSSTIISLKETIKWTDSMVTNFDPNGSKSEDVYQIITRLSSFNQISQMIYTFGKRPTEVYLKLRRENKSVDKFLKDQTKHNLSRISDNDMKRIFDQLFQDDGIIMPNCDTQFASCPYYRLSELITEFKEKMDEEIFDDETLNYIKIISNNIDNILNELDRMKGLRITDKLRDSMRENLILNRLENKLPLFNISEFQEYLTILREYEIYHQNLEKLQQYEQQMKMIHTSGIDSQLREIEDCKSNITFYKNNITTLESDIRDITSQLEIVDQHIGLVTKYNDGKKYKQILESTLDSTMKVLLPLESAAQEKIELQVELSAVKNKISYRREEAKQLENRINEYRKLVKESQMFDKKYKDYEIIEKAVSTRKGIPVLYMKRYLGKIQQLSNDLLELIYRGKLKLSNFNVTPEAFEVPYVKNGHKISDVKYASQSEISLITMALSFALANRASGKYNILLLDEIDAGLDDENRASFLKMLYQQIQELNAEQVFIISHNMSQMININMDVIRLSDIGIRSKLQNIIYE